MKGELSAIIKKDGSWWIGWIKEIPGANAQERTKKELLISLKEVAIDILDIHSNTAKQQAKNSFEEVAIAI
ncbi:MAG: type II toxin-antitoxin system HicB family antitoxin [Gammaproteobacteria bacterium]|nr:MAG: type II toxin-antitoxin system HicB family antitoxin [Gammaproteobacteria bacterium]